MNKVNIFQDHKHPQYFINTYWFDDNKNNLNEYNYI